MMRPHGSGSHAEFQVGHGFVDVKFSDVCWQDGVVFGSLFGFIYFWFWKGWFGCIEFIISMCARETFNVGAIEGRLVF